MNPPPGCCMLCPIRTDRRWSEARCQRRDFPKGQRESMMKACHVLSTAVTIKINDAEYDQIQIMEKAGRETEKEQKNRRRGNTSPASVFDSV